MKVSLSVTPGGIARAVMAVFVAAGLLPGVSSSPALAGYDLEFAAPPTQRELDDLTFELGTSLAPVAMSTAAGLGTAHVDAGLVVTGTQVNSNEGYWRNAFSDDVPSYLVSPRAVVRVGLPGQVDIGATYAAFPASNMRLIGGEVKWAFIREKPLVPAVAVRAAHNRLQGVNQFDLDTTALDLSVGKNFPVVHPYAGVGRVWYSSDVHGIPGSGGFSLDSSGSTNRYYVGARLSLAWFGTTFEVQRSGGLTGYGLKLGFSFP